ncbi:MAG TPA: glycosyltransferase family 2 protein [Actinomycetota bacterium]|nr:glycosyltransferase family 2 protein [Actinomycetota bacterium]
MSRHVVACLVHEAPRCVLDLVDNLRFLDPDAMVLLYDGGTSGVCHGLHLDGYEGVVVHPAPRPIAWGRLHDFAVDCMRSALEELDAASLTMIDSDQLAVRPGYSHRLSAYLVSHPRAGCLVSAPGVQPRSTLIGPAQAAWSEFPLWQPFLRRFPGGEECFPHWTFWPATVFTRPAAEDVVAMWQDDQFQDILSRSSLWASEEVLLPSLVALAGHEVVQNCSSYDFVQYRKPLSPAEVEAALERPDVFWVHPVPREYDDPIRARVRARFGGYGPDSLGSALAPGRPALPRPAAPASRHLPRRTRVSCIMPTHNRRFFVPQAIRCFLRQDLAESELIVVDDGTDPVADLIPDDPRIRYLRLPERHTIGQKRNIGCAQAWGEIIVHWDDDDWMASWRLSHQVESLSSGDVDVSGLRSLLCYEIPEGRAWRYEQPDHGRPWVAGATFCYRRSLWERHPFADTNDGSDTGYLWEAPAKRVGVLADASFYVALLHGDNASSAAVEGPSWRPCPPEKVARLMGEDWAFYRDTLREPSSL